ncbi:Uncharacterised protein [Clostridium tertium]|uniref:Uncharacterized protein n=1 Tax=Clostridium tertium TaxID=1559 RepID=A0A6N3EPW8_9CLOT
MKLKNFGKLAVLIAAGTALVATLINDNKEKADKEELLKDRE